MINAEERRSLNRYIVIDMAIKSLQKDYAQIEQLKMANVFIPVVDQLLKEIRNEFFNKKRLLAKSGIEVIKWLNKSEYFSEVIIKTKGEDMSLDYGKQALKSQVEELINDYLNK